MQQSDYTRFQEYFLRVTKEEFFRAEHLAKGGDPLMFPKVGGEFLKDLSTLPAGTCRVSRFALTLFGRHFVEPEGLPGRIGKFLDVAQGFAKTYRPELYGWCPLQMYRYVIQVASPRKGCITSLMPHLQFQNYGILSISFGPARTNRRPPSRTIHQLSTSTPRRHKPSQRPRIHRIFSLRNQ